MRMTLSSSCLSNDSSGGCFIYMATAMSMTSTVGVAVDMTSAMRVAVSVTSAMVMAVDMNSSMGVTIAV